MRNGAVTHIFVLRDGKRVISCGKSLRQCPHLIYEKHAKLSTTASCGECRSKHELPSLAARPVWPRRTAEQWAQLLVDNVSTATQLDTEKGELSNLEDWRMNARSLFGILLQRLSAYEDAVGLDLTDPDRSVDDALVDLHARALKAERSK